MYTITQYTKDQARKLGVKVRPSTKAHKKIDVVSSDGEVVASVGDVRYADYPTYVKEKGREYADKRRELYKKRHEKNRHVRGTPSFYADQLLW